MTYFEKTIYFLSAEANTPKPFGLFHLLSIAFVVITTLFLAIKYNSCSQKKYNLILFISWIALLLFEGYKEIILAFNFNGEKVTWKYDWSNFPFQFCSTPLYVLPLMIFLKDGKVKDALTAFYSTFVVVAGVIVYAIPSSVFVERIGINLQTMYHHGMQIITGVFVCVYNRNKISKQNFLSGCAVFLITVFIACILNVLGYYFIDDYFNMFYISPFYPSSFELATIIKDNIPHLIFVSLYCVGFFWLSVGLLLIEKKWINSPSFQNKILK